MRSTRIVLSLGLLGAAVAAPASAATPSWRVARAPSAAPSAQFTAISFDGSADGWAVGVRGASLSGSGLDGLTERWDGGRWHLVPSVAFDQSDEALTGVSAVGPSDAWAVGWHDPYGTVRVHGLVLHWDGTAWTVVQDAAHSSVPVAVDARTASDVWAVGDGLIEHYDGTSWNSLPAPDPGLHLRAVAAVATDDVWAAGGIDDTRPGYHHDLPYLAHWDGSTWSRRATPYDGTTGTFTSISARTASDVWVVGTDGSQSAAPVSVHITSSRLRGVRMPAVGDWSPVSGVVAVSAHEVWAVGDRNGALPDGFAVLRTLTERFDGRHWHVVASPNDSDADDYLTAVDTAGGTGVFAVGADGDTLVERHG